MQGDVLRLIFSAISVKAKHYLNKRQYYLPPVNNSNQITRSQEKALKNAQAQLDRLDDMLIRDVISEHRYKKQVAITENNIKQLTEELTDSRYRAESWHEIFKKSIEACTKAHLRFKNGNQKTKRQIMLELGIEFYLTDNQLTMKTEKWIQLVADKRPQLESEFYKVRTKDLRREKEVLEPQILTWLGD